MTSTDRPGDSVGRARDPLPKNQHLGWAMFGLSGLLFLVAGLRAGDWLTVVASVLWIVGCVAFVRS